MLTTDRIRHHQVMPWFNGGLKANAGGARKQYRFHISGTLLTAWVFGDGQ